MENTKYIQHIINEMMVDLSKVNEIWKKEKLENKNYSWIKHESLGDYISFEIKRGLKESMIIEDLLQGVNSSIDTITRRVLSKNGIRSNFSFANLFQKEMIPTAEELVIIREEKSRVYSALVDFLKNF